MTTTTIYRTLTIVAALHVLLPAELKSEVAIGDEIEIDAGLSWDSKGYATVETVSYCGVELSTDFNDEVEPTSEEEVECGMEHDICRGDYLYDCMKDREFDGY